jgi:hypothetical protein
MSSTCLSLIWVGLGRVGSVRVRVGVVVACLPFPWNGIGVFHPQHSHERSAAPDATGQRHPQIQQAAERRAEGKASRALADRGDGDSADTVSFD